MRAVAILVGLAAAGVLAWQAWQGRRAAGGEGKGAAPDRKGNGPRIVSLAPSITETVFALGMGDRLAGVTRYCDFPPEATPLPKVGGYFDPNYEAIVTLAPDLVILLAEHQEAQARLAALGIRALAVENRTLDGIVDGIETIGREVGAEARSRELAADIRQRLAAVRQRSQGQTRPRVLICIGRSLGAGTLKEVYIAGRDRFYGPMIEIAGGTNAYDGSVAYPTVSVEGIMHMNPEVIVDLVVDKEKFGLTDEGIVADWRAIPNVAAATANRIHVLSERYVVVPGPRFVRIVEDLARVLHPKSAPETL